MPSIAGGAPDCSTAQAATIAAEAASAIPRLLRFNPRSSLSITPPSKAFKILALRDFVWVDLG
jgi:hypothetical protein